MEDVLLKILAFTVTGLIIGGLSAGVAFAFFDVDKGKGLLKAFVGGFVTAFILLMLCVH